ncbi:hypothetical protein D9M69_477010 [compost metagenome]
MRHLDLGLVHEQLHGQVVRAACAGRGEIHLAGVLLRVINGFLQRARRELGVGHQHQREARQLADIDEVLVGVVRQLLVQRRIGRERGGVGGQHGVAVGLGVRDGIGADDGGRARPVVDHHLLAQPRRDRLGDGARHHVGAAAGRVGHDPADRLGGPVIGVRGRAGGEQGAGGSHGGQHEMGMATPKGGTQGAHR